MTKTPVWMFSIVSHGHAGAITKQLSSLAQLPTSQHAELVLTMNRAGEGRPQVNQWPGPIRWIENNKPKSFAANHNAAVRSSRARHIAIIDPDLEWQRDPFPELQSVLESDDVAMASPCFREEGRGLADNARPIPTLRWVLSRRLLNLDDAMPRADDIQDVPWLAGLFMAARRSTWLELQGFDERFRLYAEDVDLCMRAWVASHRVCRTPTMAATHRSRRESRWHPLRFYWHLRSLIRLWSSPVWRQFRSSKFGRDNN